MLVHTTNARTEGDRVILDAPVAEQQFPPVLSECRWFAFDVAGVSPNIRRWTFDLDSSDTDWNEEILFDGMRGTSMVRMDDRYPHAGRSAGATCSPWILSLPFDRERGGNLSVRVANICGDSTTTRVPSTALWPAVRTACPSRSSSRAAAMRRRARGTGTVSRMTSRRCARSC